MKSRLFFVAFLILAAFGCGCRTTAGTAQILWGRWESGRTVLILSPHGLYSLFHEGTVGSGKFGLSSANQILVNQFEDLYPLRNLWQINQLDHDHLGLTFPGGQKVDFSRAKASSPPAELVGLWQAPADSTHWNFYEFTPTGDYIRIQYRARAGRRLTSQGHIQADATTLSMINQNDQSHGYTYVLTGESIHLKDKIGKREYTYNKAASARNVE